MNDSDEIIYKKSWTKLILILLVLSVFTLTFLLMGFSDEISWPWVAWIISAASGQLFSWNRIKSIDHMVHSVSHVYLSTIHIQYDDESIKPFFYFMNKKLASPKLIIHQYKLNASQDEIYESLKNAYERFGKSSK